MATQTWSGTAQGRWLDGGNWIGGVAPAPGDSWIVNGAGDAPIEIGGIYEVNSNPLVDLYGPNAVPSLLGDPDPSLIPNAEPIVSPSIAVNGGSAVVGLDLIGSTIAAGTSLTVTGIAVMQGDYTDTLDGTIGVLPTQGAGVDANGDDGELDIVVYPVGSYNPTPFERRDYTPAVQNAGTISVASGAGFNIGFEGAPPQLTTVGGVATVLGGYDAFINTGTIALADSSMQAQGGAYAGEGAAYNTLLNDGLISLGPAVPGANANQDIGGNPISGAAFFDVTVGGSGTIALAGQGTAQAAAEFLGSIQGNTIAVADGNASFAGVAVNSYSGAIVLRGGGTVDLAIGTGQTQTFLPIDGFAAGDAITVPNGLGTPTVSWDAASHLLTIGDDYQGLSITQAVVTIEGNYGTSDFTATLVGSDIVVTTDVHCFAAGTRIATPAGERAIETLRPGDRVTVRGGASRPVTRIGRWEADCRRDPETRPVRVRADALAPGLPRRDVLLSPDHAVLIDGVLIPARLLVNGASIAAMDVTAIIYYHVELSDHDILFAEGMAAESHLPGDGSAADRAARSRAPFTVAAERVRPIWRWIAARAALDRPLAA